MNYQHMSEDSTSSNASIEVSTPTNTATTTASTKTQSTSAVASAPLTTLTITREGAQQPAILAVHTSSTLSKPGVLLLLIKWIV